MGFTDIVCGMLLAQSTCLAFRDPPSVPAYSWRFLFFSCFLPSWPPFLLAYFDHSGGHVLPQVQHGHYCTGTLFTGTPLIYGYVCIIVLALWSLSVLLACIFMGVQYQHFWAMALMYERRQIRISDIAGRIFFKPG